MPIDRAKVQKTAESFMASGKVERAIDEFLKLLEDKPDDFGLMNRIGDSYLQIGRAADAMDLFKKAGLGFERGGFTNRAAAIYKKAHRSAPEDIDIAARLAECYRQTNMVKDAIQIHIDVAEHFTKKGLLKRALEEFAKVVELDPKNLKNKVKLADLYNREGMKERAADIYLEVAESLAIENMHAEAQQVVERAKAMVSSPKVFLTLNRLCVIQKDLAGAAQHLRDGLQANPRSIEILEALAEVELQAKAPERALESLAQIPQLPEKAAALCERALRELARGGRADEGLRLFKGIGREFARRGLGELAARTLQNALQGIPFPLEAWLQLAEIAQQSGDREGRIAALGQALREAQAAKDGPLVKNLSEQLSALGVDPGEAGHAAAPAFAPPPAAPAADRPAMTHEPTEVDPVKRMQVEQLTREAEQFLRNRFNDRAQEAYQKILELSPTHRDAIHRIADIIKATGKMTAVHGHYTKVAQTVAPLGHTALALECLDRAEELFPGSTRLLRRMLALEGAALPVPAPLAAPPAPAPSIPLGSGPGQPPTDEVGFLIGLDEGPRTPLPPPAPVPLVVPAIPLALPGEPLPETLEAGDLAWDDLAEELPVEDLAAPPALSAPEALPVEDLESLDALELEPLPFAQGKVPTPPPGQPAPLPMAAGPVAPPAALDEDLASTLSDIDFQLDYGSPEEAKLEIETALRSWPGQPELLDRLQLAEEALKRLGHPSKAAALDEDQEFTHTFFDLTDVLGDSILEAGEGEEMHDATNVVEKVQSVEELFNAFREGVEQQVKSDDYDTHYNLGIAYKEMMLIEPALEEFKKAMRDPERTLECCSMLSICEQSQGNLEAAMDWLRQGIDAPGFPPEDSIGLRYDLGDLLLQQGRAEEAKTHFRVVAEFDPDYREVAKRLA